MRFILLLLYAVLLLAPLHQAGAQTTVLPEFNPVCWRKRDCFDVRKAFVGNTQKPEDGFISGSGAPECPGGEGENKWGKCLPAGVAKSEISFGGKPEFSDIGDFILTIYRYLLTVASILAVIMIIFAGVQWITSGGNSDTINRAKKRITGALTGLFIAFTSYFILNTINPALVNLRLPQVYMIRPQNLMPEFCGDVEGAQEGKILFAFAAEANEQKKPLNPTGMKLTFDKNYQQNKQEFACGRRYFAEAGGKTACWGDVCPQKSVRRAVMCVQGAKQEYQCVRANISGRIRHESFEKAITPAAGLLTEAWKDPPIKSITLALYCKLPYLDQSNLNEQILHGGGRSLLEAAGVLDLVDDLRGDNKANRLLAIISPFLGKHISIGYYENLPDGKTQAYYIAVPHIADKEPLDVLAERICREEGRGGVKGLVLIANMNEAVDPLGEFHAIGRGGIDLGDISRDFDGFFDENVFKIDEKYFFSVSDILRKGGLRLDIDATQITDIDNGSGSLRARYRYLCSNFECS